MKIIFSNFLLPLWALVNKFDKNVLYNISYQMFSPSRRFCWKRLWIERKINSFSIALLCAASPLTDIQIKLIYFIVDRLKKKISSGGYRREIYSIYRLLCRIIKYFFHFSFTLMWAANILEFVSRCCVNFGLLMKMNCWPTENSWKCRERCERV